MSTFLLLFFPTFALGRLFTPRFLASAYHSHLRLSRKRRHGAFAAILTTFILKP